MNPSAIQNLLDESKLLHDHALNDKQYTIPAFISSWIAWEALRTRFIRVVIHHKGWLLKDADSVLAKKRISSMSATESVILGLGLKHPHQWSKKSAKGWKALAEIEPLRHRLIHGFKAMDPIRVQAATKVVICSVSNHDWLSTIPIVDASKEKDRIVVGSLLKHKRSSKTTHNRCIQELADIMNVDLNKVTKPLPSLDRLEDMLKVFIS
ncbi:hypothetical protein PseudUWO311_15525 [Pseudanabaena sp. UWO311]|uniref:hypothetical protein n=1 Tax=Pseudanabaena sp. UWO311 TaxID=2487337 RepID=UPI00115B9018|nr:hypothetical protein [Pseudanabaena sp. UWO311]TYQ25427.1 hypothetical protein PseudUWO311_15525 [Pseudanabaena sp. UWO311]